MVNEFLINLVNSVLGEGKIRSKGNRAYICPFHPTNSHKLEINFDESSSNFQHWACWSCPPKNKSKGKSILSLFKKKNVSDHYLNELNRIIPNKFIKISPKNKNNDICQLPKEYLNFKFNNNILERKALNYLKSRNIHRSDIIKYNIGYCIEGKYSDRIIIPSYDENGELNFFTGRSYVNNDYKKYDNSPTSKDIIIFDLLINWDLPIILVEGVFDAIAVKRNVIPIMGKSIQPSLLKKIIEKSVKKIYIALDNDAIESSIEFCEKFMNEGKKVYLVKLNEKDPSKMGFEEFTNLIQNSKPLTEYSLMELKLQI